MGDTANVPASASSGPGYLMGFSSAIQGTSSLGSSIMQSQALRSQGAYQEQAAQFNSRMAGLQAKDAQARGNLSANRRTLETKAAGGAQRAALAAQGISTTSGSARDIQSDTQAVGELDALTIRNNAWRESWGLGVQAQQYATQGTLARMGAENAAGNTLLTGGMQALGSGLQSGYYFRGGGK